MSRDSNKRSIKEAISKKQAINFSYKKEEREGNPHILGTLINSNEAIRIYDTEAKEKGVNKFRLMLLDDIENVVILNTKFKKAKGFNKDDKDFKKITDTI